MTIHSMPPSMPSEGPDKKILAGNFSKPSPSQTEHVDAMVHSPEPLTIATQVLEASPVKTGKRHEFAGLIAKLKENDPYTRAKNEAQSEFHRDLSKSAAPLAPPLASSSPPRAEAPSGADSEMYKEIQGILGPDVKLPGSEPSVDVNRPASTLSNRQALEARMAEVRNSMEKTKERLSNLEEIARSRPGSQETTDAEKTPPLPPSKADIDPEKLERALRLAAYEPPAAADALRAAMKEFTPEATESSSTAKVDTTEKIRYERLPKPLKFAFALLFLANPMAVPSLIIGAAIEGTMSAAVKQDPNEFKDSFAKSWNFAKLLGSDVKSCFAAVASGIGSIGKSTDKS